MTGRGSHPAWLAAALVILLLVLAGCSWQDQEPGLFGRPKDDPTATPPAVPTSRPSASPEPGNPDLPVVGEALWTSAEGRDVTVRLAIHAVRRIAGGTVLDWSVTPISAAGREPGDRVPPSINLGLARLGEGTTNIALIDRDHVYRPLTRRTPSTQNCLCTSIPAIEDNLRIGVTTLAQLVFPELPAGAATIDVDIPTVPIFWHVPVTPQGMVPAVSNPTQLTRLEDRAPPVAISKPFRYEPARQHYLVVVEAVYAASSFTSLAWRIRSLDAGFGLDAADAPPITDAHPPPVAYNLGSAGGPQLAAGPAGRPVLSARLITTKGSPRGGLECLCTDLRLWPTAMRSADAEAMVVTNFAPLPAGTAAIDVVIPGVTTLADVPVTPAPDATFRSAGPRSWRTAYWKDDEPIGWRARDWPTPVPSPRLIAQFRATVDAVVR